MNFDIKKKTNAVLETYRIHIIMGHGDADHFEQVHLGPYKKDDLFVVAGIVKAFEEMDASDKETNNEMAYDHCPHFRRFLKKHWKEDLFARQCDIERYAYVKDYHIFYTDENGIEYEIENVECNEKPKRHYYLKVENGNRFDTFFSEWHVITTYEPLDTKTVKQWRLTLLPDGERFIKTYAFEEAPIDFEDLEEDREFLITGHFEPAFETVKQEDAFYNFLDELKQ